MNLLKFFKRTKTKYIKFHRKDDPNDYPTKPTFLGIIAGYNGESLNNNPYLDASSSRDWLYGYKSGALSRLEHQQRPHWYGLENQKKLQFDFELIDARIAQTR